MNTCRQPFSVVATTRPLSAVMFARISVRTLALFVLAGMTHSAAMAHHSRANFDDTRSVELTGTLLKYGWRNPHVYLEIEAADDAGVSQTWLIEAHSVTGMRGQGWDAETLTPGSTITVSGQPDRDPAKHFILLEYVEMADGSRLYPFGRGQRAASNRPEIEPSEDFSGTWAMDLSQFNVRLAGGGPPADWSLTELGLAMADAFSAEDNPELECLPIGVPKITLYPYGINWFRTDDRIYIEKEHLDEKRIILLNTSSSDLEGAAPSFAGTSRGYFESERHLIVETSGFLPTRWGNANGIDSSERKSLIEHYRLAGDGLSMDISYTIEDPEYLTAPATVTGRYLKTSNRAFTEYGCDREAASRHLSVD